MKRSIVSASIVFISAVVFFAEGGLLVRANEIDSTNRLNPVYSANIIEEQEMSRENFCVRIAKILGLNQSSGVEMPFNDVDLIKSENITFISSLYAAGILAGAIQEDGLYMMPDASITSREAILFMGRGLGLSPQNDEGEDTEIDYAAVYWDWFLENNFVTSEMALELDEAISFNNAIDLIYKVMQYSSQNEVAVSGHLGTGSRGDFDGEFLQSRFTLPHSVLIDNEGNLIIFDTYNNLIRKAVSGKVETIAGNIVGLDDNNFPKGFYKDGELGETLLNRPSDGVISQEGDLYFLDSANHVIRFIKNDRVFTFSGTTQGFNDGPAVDAQFNNPMAIAIDENDNIYVADTLNHCIRKVDTEGNVVTIAGVPGESGYVDGMAENTLFNEPTGIAVRADGSAIYISDTGNHRIRKLENGEIVTLAGSTSEVDEDNFPYGGFRDGAGEQAMFNLPRGLTLAGDHLFIADSANSRIRVINMSGNVMTLCGNGEPGDKTGNALESSLNHPMGVHFYDGLIYISDTTNNKIKVMPFRPEIYE